MENAPYCSRATIEFAFSSLRVPRSRVGKGARIESVTPVPISNSCPASATTNRIPFSRIFSSMRVYVRVG